MEVPMKVFDFDNTLYRGESSIDLSFYMVRYNRRILLYVPTILISLVRYKMCLMEKSEIEKLINDFFADVLTNSGNESDLINSFWETHAHKLNQRLLELIEPEDVIMTASPSFLLDGIRSRLNTDQIICTEVDVDEKKITWFNFGENKAVRFHDLYGDRKIDEFYTDSYNDRALMKLARRVYIVKKGIPHRVSRKHRKKLRLQ